MEVDASGEVNCGGLTRGGTLISSGRVNVAPAIVCVHSRIAGRNPCAADAD